MINHFPNFVCWKEIYQIYDKSRDTVYLDSISCYVLGLLFGVKGNYFSGPEMAHSLAKKPLGDFHFLLSEEIGDIEKAKKLVLPFKESFIGDKSVLEFINSVPVNGKVILGISSPKQNVLAAYLFSVRSDLEYFCLGAAVKQTWGFNGGNTRLRGTGFQWVEFLLFQPKRTLGKQAKTLVEAFAILCSPTRIKLFREFVAVTKKNV
ncbi:hypothetical protein N9H54_01500 [Gammaproteobacteria bacterium]|nr:hypothetical protein [Gammaproteobacteria bacterium]